MVLLNNLVDTDTAEEVVNEMIQEQVLPATYKQLITSEINVILRELNDTMSWAEKADKFNSLPRGSTDEKLVASSPPPEITRKDSQIEEFVDFPVRGTFNLT